MNWGFCVVFLIVSFEIEVIFSFFLGSVVQGN